MTSTVTEQQKFGALLTQLAELKQELSKEKIAELVQEKKSKVGGGYLTDQGALFLVASDLGVALNFESANSTKLGDITPDVQSLSVRVTVLSHGPARSFSRKTDSKPGLLARLVIYDETAACGVNLWDSKATIPVTIDLKPGDSINISNAYTRLGLDGSIVLNVGEKGSIEKIASDEQAQPIEKRAVPIDIILEPARFLIVKAVVKGRASSSSFIRSNGSSGNLVSFTIGSETEPQREMRVVVWENANPVFQNLTAGEKITLLNLRSKLGRSMGEESIELHGDDTTSVLEYSDETLHWMKKNSSGATDLSGLPEKGKLKQGDPTSFIARILSIGQESSDGSSVRLLLADSLKRKISTTVAKEDIDHLGVNDVVLCKPESIDYLAFKANCPRKGSLSRVGAKRPDIPDSSSLVTKIENLADGSTVSLEVMSLAESISREVQTKDGVVRRSELQVGDPTGEIRLYGWRDLSKLLDKIPAGVRMWLLAVEVQSHEGRRFLNLKNYSRIERNA
ncbi:MAG: hypothetical protein ACYC7D_07115 [Nitrososphaerales archaeon]